MSATDRAYERRRRLGEWAATNPIQGHKITPVKDYGKAFRSRPGSADWKPHCECGWVSSIWCYGAEESFATGAYHLKAVERERTPATTREGTS